jgi:hypothetical protein
VSSERESPEVKTEGTFRQPLATLIVGIELVGDALVNTEAVLWL